MAVKTCIVLDTYDESGWQDKVFLEPQVEKGFGECFLRHLKEEVSELGLYMHTADVYLERRSEFDSAFCITDMQSRHTATLLNLGVTPLIRYSLESPIIAKRFYFGLRRRAKQYKHHFLFEAAKNRVEKGGSQFHRMYYPVCSAPDVNTCSWEEKRLLVLMNSNKRAMDTEKASVGQLLKAWYSKTSYALLRNIDPMLSGPELYKTRIEMIGHFGGKGQLDLFGFGWENKIAGFPANYTEAAKNAYRGSVALSWKAKLDTLAQYRFCICFENFGSPGYVTEKINDCILAGTVPIYLGAPDIADYVPEGCFLAYDPKLGPAALEKQLMGISEDQYHNMLQAGKAYLSGPGFQRFSAKKLARRMTEVIKKEVHGH